MTLTTLHNRHLPPLPQDSILLAWIPMGSAAVISERAALSACVERDTASDSARLVLRVHYGDGSSLRADTPEDLAHLTTDAVVRRVDSDARGTPLRVLVEIGDMVAYPRLRERAA